jgi:hypothetical protein
MRVWIVAAASLGFVLTGCSSPPEPPQVFPVLDYSYLPPITLKVSSLTISNDYVPSPDEATLLGQDPEPPATAVLTMLNHRLVASGTPGTGTVNVETASISSAGAYYTGTVTVDVNVVSGDGRTTGEVEASVTSNIAAPDANASPDEVRAALYLLTKKLMEGINVQLPYQMQRHLGSFILATGTGGAVPAPVTQGAIQATPLGAPTAIPPAPPTVPGQTLPGTLPVAPPPAH